MIVKVQLSITTGYDSQQVLIYSKDRSVYHQCAASKEVIAAMEGGLRKFFEAHIDDNKMIVLDDEVPKKDW